MILDDTDELKILAKKLKIKSKTSNNLNNSPLPSKRSRKPKRSWSFGEDIAPPPKKNKVETKKNNNKELSTNLKCQVQNLINQNNSTDVQKSKISPPKEIFETSPSKEELKMMIEQQQKLLISRENSKSEKKSDDLSPKKTEENDIISDSDDDDSNNDRIEDDSDKNKNKYQEKKTQENDNQILVEASVEGTSRDDDFIER
ncbi:Protein of unknown function [Cotesia congregata]|uniref:Uncharacterized protein n=1 Tax=Cotesia congregata TaxID=51543 RepID=A0A8J2E8R4_COTCN|nr:Protein of unknown function [Cotesia congregata]